MDAHKTGPKCLKRPRLTPLDRLRIEAGLQNGESPYSIARRIGHDLKTVLREIRDRARTIKTGVDCRLSNKCVHRADCKEDVCAKLQKSPHVCNGCPSLKKCVLTRRTYDGAEAQKDYERLLSESRKGVNLTEEEVAKSDQLLHDLAKKGQSVHAVMVNNASLFTFCEKRAYRYINGGLLMTKRHHLPRACPIRPRRGDKPVEARVDKACVKAAFDLVLSRLAKLHHGDNGEIFGIRKVSPNDVVLKPSLLGIEVKIKEWVLKEDSGK